MMDEAAEFESSFDDEFYRRLDAWADEFDETRPSARIAFDLAKIEFADREATRATADRMAGILRVLDAADANPEVYVPIILEPTREDRELAVRAAGADLAVRLHVSEHTVFAHARTARTLRDRAPKVWADFHDGCVSVPNARHLAEVLDSMPVDTAVDAKLDTAALEMPLVAPARFRARMRVLRERLHPESLEDRQRAAAETRRTAIERADDGMSWYSIYGPAPTIEEIDRGVDARAAHLADQAGESRTMDQLRADVAVDLLRGHGTGHAEVNIDLGITVPVLTLLGTSDEPAMLEGYGPVDLATAKELVGKATSFTRILTHPINGTVLDVDRTTYRVPAALKRWLKIRHQVCGFSGCGRPAARCDIDHSIRWVDGGPTAAHNLAPVCEPHHRLKDETRWQLDRHPDGALLWTSPTGKHVGADPPPF